MKPDHRKRVIARNRDERVKIAVERDDDAGRLDRLGEN